MNIEQWKDVPHTNGLYKVSNLGRFKSLNTRTGIPSITKGSLNKNRGYLYYSVQVKRKNRKNWIAHRLVATVFIPNPHNLSTVDHIDGNKTNNAVSNLEWVTQKENNRRAIENGQSKKFVKGQGNSKLNWEKVAEIRKKRELYGTKYDDLAKEYGVKYSTIAHIIRGSRW